MNRKISFGTIKRDKFTILFAPPDMIRCIAISMRNFKPCTSSLHSSCAEYFEDSMCDVLCFASIYFFTLQSHIDFNIYKHRSKIDWLELKLFARYKIHSVAFDLSPLGLTSSRKFRIYYEASITACTYLTAFSQPDALKLTEKSLICLFRDPWQWYFCY